MENTTVKSAFEVSESALYRFYQKTFGHRFDVLKDNWKWLYRTSLVDDKVPLIIEHESEVIAHAGMLLQYFNLNGTSTLSQWFVDFAVADDWQRKGLGIALTNKWMTFTDCQITFCNYKSLGVFKKFGWMQGDYAYDHIFALFPGNQRSYIQNSPIFIRKLLSRATAQFFYNYSKIGANSGTIVVQDCSSDLLRDFYHVPEVGIRHDEDFFRWRLEQSPHHQEHCIVQHKDTKLKAIVRLNRTKQLISILKINDQSDRKMIIRFIATLANWGIKKGYMNLRFLTSDKKLSALLDTTFKCTIGESIFAYYSPIPSVMQLLKESSYNWQIIDSDFDLT